MLKNFAWDSWATALAWSTGKSTHKWNTIEGHIQGNCIHVHVHVHTCVRTKSYMYMYVYGAMSIINYMYVRTNIVFPLPGGPNRSSPLQGDLRPVNSWIYEGCTVNSNKCSNETSSGFAPTSGLRAGRITISWSVRLGKSSPTVYQMQMTFMT